MSSPGSRSNNFQCIGIFQAWICHYSLLFFLLSWNLKIVQSTRGEIQLTIPAVGRTAQLGYVYNEVKDEIIEMSVFKDITANESVFVKRMQTSDYTNDFGFSSTFEDKFRLQNIDSNTGASILSGLISPEGSSSFLTNEKSTYGKQSGSLLYKYKFVVEELQIFSESIKELYDQKAIIKKEVTHVVTGITWGANVAIQVNFKLSSLDCPKLICENEMDQKYLVYEELEDAAKQFMEEKSTNESNILLSMYSDISPQNQNTSEFKTQRQIQQFLKQMPQIIQSTNSKKGVPIQINLTPISSLRNHLKIKTEKQQVRHSLNNWILTDFIEIFDEIAFSEMHLNDLQEKFKSQPNCISSQNDSELKKILFQFNNYVRKFRSNFQEALIKARLGESSRNSLSILTRSYKTSEFSLKKIRDTLNVFGGAVEKIKYCNFIKTHFPSVEYFGKPTGQNLEDRILETMSPVPIYIMFTKSEFMTGQQAEYRDVSSTFFDLLNRPFIKRFLIDCDFEHAHCNLLNQTVIKELRNGKFTTLNVVAESRTFTPLKPIRRGAIGRIAQMAEIYDARTDTFLQTSLLSDKYEESLETNALNTMDEIDNVSNNYKSFDVDSNLQFSILAGLIQFSSHAHFITMEKDQHSFGFVQHSSIEHINVSHVIQQGALNLHLLYDEQISGSATHFVSQIIYGSTIIFSLKRQKDVNANASDFVPARTKILLQNVVNSFAENATRRNETVREVWEHLEAEAFSEISIFTNNNAEIVKTFKVIPNSNCEQLLNYLTEVFTEHEEKKQPIAYELYPIENLRIFSIFTKIVSYMDLSSVGQDAKDFEEILFKIDQANNDIMHLSLQMKNNFECITDLDIESMNLITESFKGIAKEFKDDFKITVEQVRGRILPSKRLEELKQSFNNQSYFKSDGKYKELEKMSRVEEKIKLFKNIKKLKNVTYIGRTNLQVSFDQIFIKEFPKSSNIYIFYYMPEWTRNEKKNEWHRCTQQFFGPLSNSANDIENKLYFVNCEFSHLHCKNLTKPTIHQYKQGELVTTNYLDFLDSVEAEAEIEKRVHLINSTAERNEKEIESMRMKVNSNRVTTDLNNIRIQTLTTQQNQANITTQETQGLIGEILNMSNANHGGILSLQRQDVEKSNTVEQIAHDLKNLNNTQNQTELAVQENRQFISVLQNFSSVNHNDMVLFREQDEIRNASTMKISEDIKSLTSELRSVNNITSANKNKIETLESAFQSVANKTTENGNRIDIIAKHIKLCEFDENVASALQQSRDTRNLDCGGLINVPTQGSMFLKFKSSAISGEEQRCLWTFHSSHSNRWYSNKLKFSVVCDKLGNPNNILTFHEWIGYVSENVSFYDLRSNTGQLLSSKYWKFRHFLYFNTKRASPEMEFVLKVDVLGIEEWETERNWFFNTIPGRVDYDHHRQHQSTSITVVPPKTRPLLFMVEHVDSETRSNGLCKTEDSLYVYELGEKGMPRRLGGFCGRLTTPTIYSTEYPVIVVFYTNSDNRGTFKVSWK